MQATPLSPLIARGLRRRDLIIAAGGAAAATLAGPALAQQATIVIKFSHVVAAGTPKGKGADFFAKRAGELTKGRVHVDVFPNSQLYKDNEEMEAVQLGSVQMLAPSLSKFAPMGLKEFEVFDLPYIFDNFDELHRITQGKVGAALLKKMDARGITGLAFWDNGFKSFSSNKPMHKPEDMKGMKMRIQSSKVLEAQMRALGCLPQVMAFSEVYQALQSGVVDGTENPHSNLFTQKMYEVQKHVSITDHGYLGYAAIANKGFWDGLPADVRAALTQAMDEATKVANGSAKQDNEESLAKVKASGKTEVHLLSADERAAFKRALIPVHKQMESRLGSDIIQQVYRETGFDPAKA